MEIREILNEEEAIYCDQLLSFLIDDEKKYNPNIKDNFKVNNFYPNIYKRNNNLILVSLIDEKIVGYIYVKTITEDGGPEISKEATIDALFVLPDYRNRGVAKALINEVKLWAKNHDCQYLNISVINKNEAALNLYHSCGFIDFSRNLKQEL